MLPKPSTILVAFSTASNEVSNSPSCSNSGYSAIWNGLRPFVLICYLDWLDLDFWVVCDCNQRVWGTRYCPCDVSIIMCCYCVCLYFVNYFVSNCFICVTLLSVLLRSGVFVCTAPVICEFDGLVPLLVMCRLSCFMLCLCLLFTNSDWSSWICVTLLSPLLRLSGFLCAASV